MLAAIFFRKPTASRLRSLKRKTGMAGEEVDSSGEPAPGGSAACPIARGRA